VFLFMSLLTENTSPLEVFICDNGPFDYAVGLKQCAGLGDASACAANVSCVKSACGYKLAAGIDLSVSGAADPLGVPTPTDVRAGFMVFWSLVPYGMFFVLFAAFLFAGDTSSLSFIALMGCLVIVNEGILKHSINQKRPPGSCLYFKSYGMPSGHAATSIGMMTSMLLEIWVDRTANRFSPSRCVFSLRNKCIFTIVLLFLLLPVPFSRVVLHDHYASQVAVGAVVGIVGALCWFVFMYKFARPRLGAWVELRVSRCFLLRNTYRTEGVLWTPEWATCKRGGTGRGRSEDDVEAELSVGSAGVELNA
jgi:membrane-associated phospholipid phosphatase